MNKNDFPLPPELLKASKNTIKTCEQRVAEEAKKIEFGKQARADLRTGFSR